MFEFLRRAKRYAVIIALVGALVAACINRLPSREARTMSALASQIERGLRDKNPDKQKMIEFIRQVINAKKAYGIDVRVPERLAEGASELSTFYAQLDNAYEQLEDIERAGFPFAHYNLGFDQAILLRIERMLGITLERERQALREYNQKALTAYQKAREKTEDESLRRKLDDKIANVIAILKALQS